MNQIVGTKDDGSKFLALVLEPSNIHRMKSGDPVHLQVESLFPDGIPKRLELGIFFSETPVQDFKELSKQAATALDERTPITKTKKPHCPECRSTIESFGVLRNESPLVLAFCIVCGCTLGMSQLPK